jgi:hypothetical protein
MIRVKPQFPPQSAIYYLLSAILILYEPTTD